MKNELFQIGGITIYAYGVLIAIGVFAAFFMADKRSNKYHLDADFVFSLGFFCLIGGLIGAKVLYFITDFKAIIEGKDFWGSILDGFVVYGGILGGALSGYLYCKIKKQPFLQYFDLVVPSIALAQGIGRIGCLMAGCCYGRPTDAFYGITFHNSGYAPNGVPLIPTQVISSILNFIHCLILIWFAKRAKKPGQVGALYLILYSIGRFGVEILRADPRGNVAFLSTSQFISIFILIGGIVLMVLCSKEHTKSVRELLSEEEQQLNEP